MSLIEPENTEVDSPSYANPHDLFGRKTLGDPKIAADFLRHYADPMIAKHVDLDHLQSDATQFFGSGFKQVMLDVPYVSKLHDESGNSEVLIVIEHKSTPCVFTPLQLDTYANLSNYDRWIKAGRPRSKKAFKLMIPVGIVVYSGLDDWTGEMSYQEMFDDIPVDFRPIVPQHRVLMINLKRFEYGRLPGQPETQAVVEAMKRAFDGTFKDHLPEILKLASSRTLDARIDDLMISICMYCDLVTNVTQSEIDRAITRTIQGPKGIQMAETVRKSIWATGREQGIAEGKAEGEISAITAFLKARFMQVPEHIVASLNQMKDPTALESLAVHAATCGSLAEFADALK